MFEENSKPAIIPEIESYLIPSESIMDMDRLANEAVKLIREAANNDEQEIRKIIKLMTIGMERWIEIKQENICDDFDFNDAMQMTIAFCSDIPFEHACLSSATLHYCSFRYNLENGDITEAIKSMSAAYETFGMAKALIDSNKIDKIKKTLSYQKMAGTRHAENRDMKKIAIEYYKNHKDEFKNKDDAALYISTKIVSVSFATARGWIKNK